ncbi:MAG: hypothetical protein OEM49_06930 [Myxococcales bacterium]|nr:hypothetical protein [Myxococcales bacterium]
MRVARCTLRGMPPPPASQTLAFDEIPAPVRAIGAALAESGHASFLVGACVRALLAGETVRDFEMLTTAPIQVLLERFELAVPTSPSGHSVTLPTTSGPVDIAGFRYGSRIEDELEHRDFTLHAMAYDLGARLLVDPHGGRSDWAKGALRAVCDAAARFAEDPLRALRAARLVASLGVRADLAIERAMQGAAQALSGVARARIREELRALLLAREADEGLALLHRGGIEQALAPGVGEDAPTVVAALPSDLDLRLAGWLRGTHASRTLRRLRYPRPRVARIERLLSLHPIDAHAEPTLDPRLRRLARREPREFRNLIALRLAELAAQRGDAASRARLDRLCTRVEALQRAEAIGQRRGALALDGRAVMEQLGCGPGPHVGRALRFLADAVAEDPTRNEPEALRALLETWRDGAQTCREGTGPLDSSTR